MINLLNCRNYVLKEDPDDAEEEKNIFFILVF